jgi:hypothetical protein
MDDPLYSYSLNYLLVIKLENSAFIFIDYLGHLLALIETKIDLLDRKSSA